MRDDDDPYGVVQLLRATAPRRDAGAGIPGLDILFVYAAYFQDPTERPVDSIWECWLTRSYGLQPCVI